MMKRRMGVVFFVLLITTIMLAGWTLLTSRLQSIKRTKLVTSIVDPIKVRDIGNFVAENDSIGRIQINNLIVTQVKVRGGELELVLSYKTNNNQVKDLIIRTKEIIIIDGKLIKTENAAELLPIGSKPRPLIFIAIDKIENTDSILSFFTTNLLNQGYDPDEIRSRVSNFEHFGSQHMTVESFILQLTNSEKDNETTIVDGASTALSQIMISTSQ